MNNMNGSIPIPIAISDITAIHAALKGYLAFLRGTVKPSHKRDAQIEVLQSLRQRFKPVLFAGLEGIPVPLTFVEVRAIDAALVGFVWLVRRMVPQSKERDDVLAGFGGLLQKLARMVAPHVTNAA